MNWNIIDPRVMTRLWTVSLSQWGDGRFESFWLKSSAMRFARANMDGWLFVDLENEWTGECVRLKPLEPYPPFTIDKTGLIIDGPGKGQYF